MTKQKTRRPYRLEVVGHQFTNTFTTKELALEAVATLRDRYAMESDARYRITLRADKGRKTTPVAEGIVK